jgi:hypothetical protein
VNHAGGTIASVEKELGEPSFWEKRGFPQTPSQKNRNVFNIQHHWWHWWRAIHENRPAGELHQGNLVDKGFSQGQRNCLGEA